MTFLADNQWLVWLAIALVLAAIETLTVDFMFVMLAGGALAASVAAAIGLPYPLQVVIGVVVAILLLAAVRPLLKRRFMRGEGGRGIGARSLVGRRAWVLQPVSETDGRVKLAGETWSARVADGARPCEPGQEVWVAAIQGAIAIVSAEPPVPEPDDPPPTEPGSWGSR